MIYHLHLTEISIHALREEGDAGKATGGDTTWAFLSTPSARRATADLGAAIDRIHISIHALREEGDRSKPIWTPTAGIFLSTPSARRATVLFLGLHR